MKQTSGRAWPFPGQFWTNSVDFGSNEPSVADLPDVGQFRGPLLGEEFAKFDCQIWSRVRQRRPILGRCFGRLRPMSSQIWPKSEPSLLDLLVKFGRVSSLVEFGPMSVELGPKRSIWARSARIRRKLTSFGPVSAGVGPDSAKFGWRSPDLCLVLRVVVGRCRVRCQSAPSFSAPTAHQNQRRTARNEGTTHEKIIQTPRWSAVREMTQTPSSSSADPRPGEGVSAMGTRNDDLCTLRADADRAEDKVLVGAVVGLDWGWAS